MNSESMNQSKQQEQIRLLEKVLPKSNTWRDVLGDFDFRNILAFLIGREKSGATIYPARNDVFKAFQLTPYDEVKIVILGQDPYHNGVANGLAFSSNTERFLPPSLRIIHKAIEIQLKDGLYLDPPRILTDWAEQGVFLFNTALTVEKGTPGAHTKVWAPFTERVMKELAKKENVVYMLWGKFAEPYAEYIDKEKNLVLMAPHPAAELYSNGKAGFFERCGFAQAVEYVKKKHGVEINF